MVIYLLRPFEESKDRISPNPTIRLRSPHFGSNSRPVDYSPCSCPHHLCLKAPESHVSLPSGFRLFFLVTRSISPKSKKYLQLATLTGLLVGTPFAGFVLARLRGLGSRTGFVRVGRNHNLILL
jgi:hypothetical protein